MEKLKEISIYVLLLLFKAALFLGGAWLLLKIIPYWGNIVIGMAVVATIIGLISRE